MFCPECGKKNEDNAKFCENCGKRLKKAVKSPNWWERRTPLGKSVSIILCCILGLASFFLITDYIDNVQANTLTELDITNDNLTVQSPGNVLAEVYPRTKEYTVNGETEEGANVTVYSYSSDSNESLKLDSQNRFNYKIPFSENESYKSFTFTTQKYGRPDSEITLILVRPSNSSANDTDAAISVVKCYGPVGNDIESSFNVATTYALEDYDKLMTSGTWTAQALTNDNYLVMHQFEYDSSEEQATFVVNLKTGKVSGLNELAKTVLWAIDTKTFGYFKYGFQLRYYP